MAKNRLFVSVYRNSIGFYTNVSFTVSVYLLTVSEIDRLQALLNHFIIIKMLLNALQFQVQLFVGCWQSLFHSYQFLSSIFLMKSMTVVMCYLKKSLLFCT